MTSMRTSPSDQDLDSARRAVSGYADTDLDLELELLDMIGLMPDD